MFAAIVFVTTKLDLSITSYTGVILWGVVLGLVILPIYYIVGSLMEREVFLYAWGYAKRFRTKLKLKRSKVTASQT
ncbi:hypothetical protein D3C75_1241270 [compost metagenome]